MATKRPGQTAVLIAVGWLAGFCAINLTGVSLQASEIHDEAGLFSPAAVTSATESLNQVEKRDHVAVRIQTYESVPSERLAAFKALPKAQWGTFYQKWIEQIARKEKSQGIIVLITKSPGHLEFYVPQELKTRGFDHTAQSGFSNKLLENFKSKSFDTGLTTAVEYLDSVGPTLKPATAIAAYNPRPVHRSGQQAARHDAAVIPGAPQEVKHRGSWGIWTWVILAVVVWLMFVVISSLIRRVSGGGMNGPGQGYGPSGYGPGGYGAPGYGGGGGFMGNMMGGLAGAMAGNWLYNSVFNSHSSAHGADWNSSNDQSMTGGSSNDGGSYGGGDFGDSSGGDFGGGDFGGGDFGGGDFGGGDF